jgi:WD40 repeat protein
VNERRQLEAIIGMKTRLPAACGLARAASSIRLLVAFLTRLGFTLSVIAATNSAAAQSPVLPVFGLAFSPDGKYLAASSNSVDPPGPVVLWNTADWSVHGVHRPAGGTIDVEFSPTSDRLAFASKSGKVGVLDVATGELVREIEAHTGAVYTVAFTPDGQQLASGGADGAIKLWNLADGALVRTFEGHVETVDGIAISPDGRLLASGGNDKTERLWDLATGEQLHSFTPADLIVRRASFSRDGALVMFSRWDGNTRIRDAATGELRAQLSSASQAAAMTRDNRRVVTASHQSAAYVHRVSLSAASADEESRIDALILQLADPSYATRIAADSALAKLGMIAEPQLRAAMQHADAEIRVRTRRIRQRALAPEPIAELGGHRGDVEICCLAPDDSLIATACRGGDIKIWDATTYRELRTLTLNMAAPVP